MFERSELKKFTESGRIIAAAAGETFEQWADREAGIVLKLWASNIPTTSEAKATIRGRSRAAEKAGVQRGPVTANTGRRGGRPGLVWSRTRNGYVLAGTVSDAGALDYKNRHFKDADWTRLSSLAEKFAGILPGAVSAGRAAVGLARNSVIQIADALGISLETVQATGSLSSVDLARARAARSSDGKQHINGTGNRERGDGRYAIELIDRYPRIRESGIDSALQTVIANRLSFMTSELARPMGQAIGNAARRAGMEVA